MTDEPATASTRQSSRPDDEGELDPRVTRSRRAVLRAATDLLIEGGPSAVTVDAIVARSGVARSTIYRHWKTRDDVLVAVIESCAPHFVVPDESLGFEEALRQLIAGVCQALSDPEWAPVLPALFALRNQKHGIAALEQRLEDRQDEVVDVVLRRGVACGRLRADFDIDQASALLTGPLLIASLMGKPPVDEAFGNHVVDVFLHSHAAD